MYEVLTAIGGATVLIMAAMIVIGIWCAVKEFVDKMKWIYIYNHRFDKPPTAKCYCKDCQYHGYDNQCFKFNGWRTADNWFCWDATPIEKAPKEMEESV